MPEGPFKPIPVVGSTDTKPPVPIPITRLTVHVVRVKFGGNVPTVEEDLKDALVEIAEIKFKKKTAANGKVTTTELKVGEVTVKVTKKKFGPVPKEGEEFKPDTVVTEKVILTGGDQTVKVQMSNGSGALVIKAFDGVGTDKPLGEVDVTVAGVGTKPTRKTGDNIGQIFFEDVPFGKVKVSGRKEGYGPIPEAGKEFKFGKVEAAPEPESKHGVTTIVELHVTHPGNTIKKIEATIKDTPGLVAAPALAGEAAAPAGNQRLKSSTSSDVALGTNKPIVLVRGCNDVTLTVTTDPAGNKSDWRVKLNENSGSVPTITPSADGKKATLKCDKTGSFAVIAADGESKVIWNVVFVHVKADVASSVAQIKLRKNTFADNGSTANSVRIRSGQFVTGNAAFEGGIDVTLVGGGADKKLGTDRIDLHMIQSGITDTLAGNYVGPPAAAGGPPVTGAGTETPPNLPIVDCNGPGGAAPSPPNAPHITEADGNSPPLIWLASSFTLTNLGNQKFRVFTLDSPGGGFPVRHGGAPPKAAHIRTVSGVNGFRTGVCATSRDAVNNIVVQADMRWQADFSGNVTYPGGTPASPALVPAGTVATWVGTTHGTTGDNTFALVSDATGGQDAAAAGFRIAGPRFNSGPGQVIVWT